MPQLNVPRVVGKGKHIQQIDLLGALVQVISQQLDLDVVEGQVECVEASD